MSKIKMSIVTLFALVIFVPQSHAGILLEPYLGYHMGNSKQTSTSKVKGVSYGARVGYQSLGLMVGAEYQGGSWADDQTPKDDITPADLGAFVGYNFPMMFRAYGTYFFNADSKVSNNTGNFTYKGNGYKLGVGYTGFPMISINFEYGHTSFDKLESSGISATVSPKMNTDFYGVTVSVPFNF